MLDMGHHLVYLEHMSEFSRTLFRLMQRGIYAFHLDEIASICHLHHRRIVSMIDGGLASQMWQFALGYVVSRESGLPVYFDIDFFHHNGCDMNGQQNRKFLLLETFPKIATLYAGHFTEKRKSLFCNLFSDRAIKRCHYDYTPEILERRSRYLQQYYAHAKYIVKYQTELRDLFSFKISLSPEESALKEKILSTPQACSVHVRRGDFVNSVHDVCSHGYYLKAMEKMNACHPGSVFYVFSNNIAYCKSIFANLPYKIIYVEGRNEYDPRVDLFLLTQFHHAIISNSGFSWFPAFLNSHLPEAKVIAPDIWCKGSLQEKSRGVLLLPGWETVTVSSRC